MIYDRKLEVRSSTEYAMFFFLHYFPVTSTLECSFRDSLPNNDEAVQRLAWDVEGIIL